jgi:hypothetical protein
MPATRTTTSRSTAADKEKSESLLLIIEEQKRDYDYLLHIFNRLRATEGLLLTAGFGIVAYLYGSGASGRSSELLQRLFFPAEQYGQVIYLIAMGFFAYAMYELMSKVFGKNHWMTAYDSSKDSYTYKALDTLIYIKQRYDECGVHNGKRYFERKDGLSSLFYRILVSAIILIVIKTLG